MEKEEIINGLILELRRGAVTLGVLSRLSEPHYGYSLVQILEEIGFPIEPGTLYPLLRRLEKQGLLESSWDTNENRPRKYYRLSELGRSVYKQLCEEWRSLSEQVSVLINK